MSRLTPCVYCAEPLVLSHDGERIHLHEVASGARHVCERKPVWRLPPMRPEPVTAASAVATASREVAMAALELRVAVDGLKEMAMRRAEERRAPAPRPAAPEREPPREQSTEGLPAGALAL